MNAVIQWLIMGALVGWSTWSILRRYAPKPVQRFKESLARKADQHGWKSVATSLRKVTVAGSDCSSGCASCKGCDTAPAEDEPKPVIIRASSGCH